MKTSEFVHSLLLDTVSFHELQNGDLVVWEGDVFRLVKTEQRKNVYVLIDEYRNSYKTPSKWSATFDIFPRSMLIDPSEITFKVPKEESEGFDVPASTKASSPVEELPEEYFDHMFG